VNGSVTPSITLDTYAHVLPDMQDRAVDAIDAALFRANSSDQDGADPDTHHKEGQL
jgi:hypothetical protein